MTKKDAGMRELLGLLKHHPELVHALVFHHKKVKELLHSEEARHLIPDKDVRNSLMQRVDDSEQDGFFHQDCLEGTKHY
jgi:hypothetical protein